MKHRKGMRKAILMAGSSMLIALYSGCQSYQPQQMQAMNDFFPPSGDVRDLHRIERVQEASGARGDATLQPYHFDKGELNSLGREELSLMLDDDDTNNPITIYLNLPSDDEFKAARQDAIIAYLKDQGLEENQVSFKPDWNPATSRPAAEGLARLVKTETGVAGSSSSEGSSSAAASGDTTTTGDSGGATSK